MADILTKKKKKFPLVSALLWGTQVQTQRLDTRCNKVNVLLNRVEFEWSLGIGTGPEKKAGGCGLRSRVPEWNS